MAVVYNIKCASTLDRSQKKSYAKNGMKFNTQKLPFNLYSNQALLICLDWGILIKNNNHWCQKID
jgi:hypothetical protein